MSSTEFNDDNLVASLTFMGHVSLFTAALFVFTSTELTDVEVNVPSNSKQRVCAQGGLA
jgi:hypothetical protein